MTYQELLDVVRPVFEEFGVTLSESGSYPPGRSPGKDGMVVSVEKYDAAKKTDHPEPIYIPRAVIVIKQEPGLPFKLSGHGPKPYKTGGRSFVERVCFQVALHRVSAVVTILNDHANKLGVTAQEAADRIVGVCSSMRNKK